MLPTNNDDLENIYTPQDETDVATKDDIRVEQTATSQYAIHQFKDAVGASNSATFEWEGQSSTPPYESTVYLQIYNQNSTLWETIDSDNSSSGNIDFVLTANVANLTNYKDVNGVVTCRVYQLDL